MKFDFSETKKEKNKIKFKTIIFCKFTSLFKILTSKKINK